MGNISKKPVFLFTARVLAALNIIVLIQLGSMVSCVCAQPDEAFWAPCCCAASSRPQAAGKDLFIDKAGSGHFVQNLCCCISVNDLVTPDTKAALHTSTNQQTFKDVFGAVMPSLCMAYSSHGAYPSGCHAEVLSFSVSPHIASTILLL